MDKIKNAIKDICGIVYEAYKAGGNLLAMLDDGGSAPDAFAAALDKMAWQFEGGAVKLRNLCEAVHPGPGQVGDKPALPQLQVSGKVEVNIYGWLHICLNALLPNCRYQTPVYLRDTISRLLDGYERSGNGLPRFDSAMLIIDEHCDIGSRRIFDQDNKGWKAIPNALKGRVIKDDDQFTLGVTLISTRSSDAACHIYLIPRCDAGDFFAMIDDNFQLFP